MKKIKYKFIKQPKASVKANKSASDNEKAFKLFEEFCNYFGIRVYKDEHSLDNSNYVSDCIIKCRYHGLAFQTVLPPVPYGNKINYKDALPYIVGDVVKMLKTSNSYMMYDRDNYGDVERRYKPAPNFTDEDIERIITYLFRKLIEVSINE